MAKTLLNGVNEIFKRVQIIAGDADALTSLTDSARQHFVDVAVQVMNEGIIDLYQSSNKPLPISQSSSTITLAASTRSYSLASDLVQLRWPFIDKTNTQFIFEYSGGYNDLLLLDPEQDDTGLPEFGAIDPTTGNIHLDRAPTSAEAGRVYTYQYDKSLLMTAASDTVPFNDDIFTEMVPAWVQLWKRECRNEFDGKLFKHARAIAAQLVTNRLPRSDWSPR